MPRKIQDTVMVITGASSGIGRATALAVAARGGTVVAVARRGQALHELAMECERLGGRALALPGDVTDEAAMREVARRTVETFGRVDVWVNNAGVTLLARTEEAPLDAYRRVMDTNFFGTLHGARAVIPYFREQGSGVLINVGSIMSEIGQSYASAYVASKWAVRSLGESLRQELRDARDVHVCTVMPAAMDTPIFQHAGNLTGRAVKPPDPVYDPEQVAATILSLAERPRREVMVGGAAHALSFLHALSPALTERVVALFIERAHFQDAPAPPTLGNLFEPVAEGTDVRGGWGTTAGRQGPLLLALAGLGIGGAVALLARRRRPTLSERLGVDHLPGMNGRRRGIPLPV